MCVTLCTCPVVCVRRRVPRLIYTSTVNVAFGGKPIEQGDEDSVPYFPLEKVPGLRRGAGPRAWDPQPTGKGRVEPAPIPRRRGPHTLLKSGQALFCLSWSCRREL